MKKLKTLVAVLGISLVAVACSSAPTGTTQGESALSGSDLTDEELAALSPREYEAYRRDKAANAATLDEFLAWATPEEIASDDVASRGDKAEALARGDSDNGIKPATVTGLVPQGVGDASGIKITVNIASQTMDAEGGGLTFHHVRVATGRPGHETPRGCYSAFSAERLHWSRKYNAPMPYSVFFLPGIAFHTGNVNKKSHGCIHLANDTASEVYEAYKHHQGGFVVCVQ